MKKLLFIKLMAVLTITFTINGCKKGDTGPKGPAGKDGTSSVTSRTFTMTSWAYTSPYYYRDLNVPELTSGNIDSSLVMVYFCTTGSVWFALPYTQYNSPYNYYMGFSSSSGNVQVNWVYNTSLSKGSDPNEYYGTTIKCKVVVIPSSAKAAKINLNNYEEVKHSYNLAD